MMTAELRRWEEECRKYEIEYEEAKKKTKELIHPLKAELSDLEDQVSPCSPVVAYFSFLSLIYFNDVFPFIDYREYC